MKKIISLSVLLLLSSMAHAIPVQWTLQNAVTGNGTLTGSFIYDADLDSYSALSITYSSPNPGAENLFGGTETSVLNGDSIFLSTAGYDTGVATQAFMDFVWAENLTNAGGTVNIGSGSVTNVYTQTYTDTVVAGSIVASAVPIPAAAWLFGSALAGLGWLRRRKAA